jgi:molybdopterin-binding protein
MTETVLKTRELSVDAGTFSVVCSEQLAIARGEVIAILGPNGSGKSTLLQALAGLRLLEHGDIERFGSVGYLPQRPVLFSGTVLRNVCLPLKLRRVAQAVAREKASDSLRAFGIEHLAGRQSRALSGGEARRVALARVLVHDPDILLLDEPFGGLDAPTKERLLEDVGILTRSGERATVLVTHDREEAVALADRIIVMADGRVEQDGPVLDVFAQPANERVAELVGSENILIGRVISCERELLQVLVGKLTVEAVGVAQPGDEVVLTVRPESIVVFTGPRTRAVSARNVFRGVVRALERRPHLVRVVCWVGEARIVATVAPATVQELGLVPGANIGLELKATSVHATVRAGRQVQP